MIALPKQLLGAHEIVIEGYTFKLKGVKHIQTPMGIIKTYFYENVTKNENETQTIRFYYAVNNGLMIKHETILENTEKYKATIQLIKIYEKPPKHIKQLMHETKIGE